MKTVAFEEGRNFNWSNASVDYAKYRDVYPEVFFQHIVNRGLCIKGQKVLDVGTGTGVLPRNMYPYGAMWTGIDRATNQITQAKKLASQSLMNIDFIVSSAEELDFPPETFDVITLCQCYWYIEYEKVMPIFAKLLKQNGKILFLTMSWLPFEDKIAGASENLVLQYTPNWVSAGATREPIHIPQNAYKYFELTYQEEYPTNVHFTKESWHGRMRACGGIGASLDEVQIAKWEKQHLQLLDEIAPQEFDVLHYVAMAELTKKHIHMDV